MRPGNRPPIEDASEEQGTPVDFMGRTMWVRASKAGEFLRSLDEGGEPSEELIELMGDDDAE